MKILIACEFSGIVREAFRRQGHNAWSCDFLETEIPGQHIQGDVLGVLEWRWDAMIAFPPCTHLAVSGARWFYRKEREQEEALQFVLRLLNAPIPRVALENPKGVISTRIRPPDQIVQPWQFGHREVKGVCLWLTGLPLLAPTNVVSGREPRSWLEWKSQDRWKSRSRTYPGIARAMASQWGSLLRPRSFLFTN